MAFQPIWCYFKSYIVRLYLYFSVVSYIFFDFVISSIQTKFSNRSVGSIGETLTVNTLSILR